MQLTVSMATMFLFRATLAPGDILIFLLFGTEDKKTTEENLKINLQ